MFGLAAFLMTAELVARAPAPGEVSIVVSGLRNSRGEVRICMTRDPAHFPDCKGDPVALTRSIPAATPAVTLEAVPPGEYAIAIFHDENNNRRLDTVFGIPREGFGFSRNPPLGFGAPRFSKVVIRIAPGLSRMNVRMQYLL